MFLRQKFGGWNQRKMLKTHVPTKIATFKISLAWSMFLEACARKVCARNKCSLGLNCNISNTSGTCSTCRIVHPQHPENFPGFDHTYQNLCQKQGKVIQLPTRTVTLPFSCLALEAVPRKEVQLAQRCWTWTTLAKRLLGVWESTWWQITFLSWKRQAF